MSEIYPVGAPVGAVHCQWFGYFHRRFLAEVNLRDLD
jgi:hypothetical protein